MNSDYQSSPNFHRQKLSISLSYIWLVFNSPCHTLPASSTLHFTGYHGVVFNWLAPKLLQVATFAAHVAGNLLCRKLFVSAPTSSTGQTLIEGQLPKLKANQVWAALGVAAARATQKKKKKKRRTSPIEFSRKYWGERLKVAWQLFVCATVCVCIKSHFYRITDICMYVQ